MLSSDEKMMNTYIVRTVYLLWSRPTLAEIFQILLIRDIFVYLHERIQRGGGGSGVRPLPLKNQKNIGFPSNIDPDSLKITKLPSQHSMIGHYRPILVAFRSSLHPLNYIYIYKNK